MQGKHSAKSSKKPLIIFCTAAAVVIAVVVALIFINVSEKNSDATLDEQTTAVLSSAVDETDAVSDGGDTQSQSTVPQPSDETSQTSQQSDSDDDSDSGETETSEKVVVPDSDSDNAVYIEAAYSPYKAVDSDTDEECTLKEVFGSAYSGGNLIFKEDGSFTDTVSASSVDSGSYEISDGKISATYSNDKNMSITVIEWDGDVPTEFTVNYGGYDVYFK